jgi:hypothetical protein
MGLEEPLRTHHAFVDGKRRRDLEKLSPAMWQMLFDIRDHGDPRHSLPDPRTHGGAGGTLQALRRRDLAWGATITSAGLDACRVEWREA